MPSPARQDLLRRLHDVDELIAAHKALTGGGRGRPALLQGAAITRAGIVLLAAAMEAFVEELFELAGDLVFHNISKDERKKLYKETSRRLNNASVHKTNMLYFNLGMPWILSRIKWQKCSNSTFQKRLNKLMETRGQIAHGKRPRVRLQQLRSWKNMVEKYAEVLEKQLATHVEKMTGTNPTW